MKKIILASLMALTLALSILPGALAAGNAASYSDIEGAWYYDAADAYAYPEIFTDVSGMLFADEDITRIEFVRLIHKALGISINYFATNDISNSFDDMSNEDTGASELIDLVTVGIVDAGGSFSPDTPLARDTMIHWTIAALDYMTGGTYPMILMMPTPFDDDADITPEYADDVIKAVLLQLINGRGDNMLYPKDGTTRAEALTVIYRLMPLIETLQDEVNVTATAAENGDKLLMTLTIRNNLDQPVTIHYTSGQQFDFKLIDVNGESLYTWSADKLFMQALSDEVIAPGEQRTFSAEVDGDLYATIRDSAVLLKAFITGTSDDFEISTDGYEAVI